MREEAVLRGPARGEEEANAEAAAGGGWQELPLLKKPPSREGAAGWYRCGPGGAVLAVGRD